MRPGARVAAAIEILDMMSDGLAAEQALTRWSRQSRFAGSKDRAAVRDYVFDVLRNKRTVAAFGGTETGRGLMLGLMRLQDVDAAELFDGVGHSPVPLSPDEIDRQPLVLDDKQQWNLPEWLHLEFERSLGDRAAETAKILRARAPVSLRVNLARATVEQAQSSLSAEGVETRANAVANGALTILEGARKLRNSEPYMDGLVELQDASSQAVVAALPEGKICLDYCAGGGGKALAMAMNKDRTVWAHDVDPRRMQDLPSRAERAEAHIQQIVTDELPKVGPFDLILCDAPCSGSGAWRRSPEAKWTLTQDRLEALNALQDEILTQAAELVHHKGTLAYATCSVLRCENEDRVEKFLAENDGWSCAFQTRFDVTKDGDGFYTAHLTRI